jgi:hypothetical protein
MSRIPKIYLIDIWRALEIMWYLDSFYDEFKYVTYEDVKGKITRKEWMISQMYFNNWYTWDYVVEQLKTLWKSDFPVY